MLQTSIETEKDGGGGSFTVKVAYNARLSHCELYKVFGHTNGNCTDLILHSPVSDREATRRQRINTLPRHGMFIAKPLVLPQVVVKGSELSRVITPDVMACGEVFVGAIALGLERVTGKETVFDVAVVEKDEVD
ncbi:hypothetical protein MLD38_004520 [Melastoma candidum]|uniref:Uncharacterized protein n=1 Tax=Melastoma candidum TaxID=119954 RepID=A0ACB9SEI4_9MYRT|nr:hypothetical protein MLD38_004520 [Melastoma candidum]